MLVLEALSCGLQTLYINNEGGGKDIYELSKQKVGEPFSDYDELLLELKLMIENYDEYADNIRENINLYNSEDCYRQFHNLLIKLGNS